MRSSIVKTVSVFAALLMLAAQIGGCGAGSGDSVDKNAGGGTTTEEKYDLGGYEVKIINLFGGNAAPAKESVTYAQEMELIAGLEKKYNCKISFPDYAGNNDKWITSNLAGDPISDYAVMSAVSNGGKILFKKNTCLPLDDYIDMTSDDLFPEVTKFGEYKGKHYLWANDKIFEGSLMAIYFNKNMFEQQELGNLYELQEKKQWNWDMFLKIAQSATKDTDGDGIIDQWGFADFAWFKLPVDAFIHSNGGAILKEENGKMILAQDEPASIEAMQFCQDIVLKYKIAYTGNDSETLFRTGKIAMLAGPIYWAGQQKYAETLKDNECGLVFFPMGPKATDYSAFSSDIAGGIFPAASKHPREITKLITELYGDYSWRMDNEEFYESLFFDEESVETCLALDKKRVYDFYMATPVVDFFNYDLIFKLIKGESPKSLLEAKKAAMIKAVDKIWNVEE